MSKKISKNVVDQIKKENVKPKPRWEFLLKEYVFEAAFVFSVLIGSLAVSLAIFQLKTTDWDIYDRFGNSFVRFFFESLPYFWILVFTAFVLIAYYNFKHTEKGYKYSFVLVTVASVLISAVLGFAMFGFGVARKVDDFALRKLPVYEKLHFKRKADRWMNPDKGRNAGKIVEIDETDLLLYDLNGEKWFIDLNNVEFIPPHLKPGDVIGVFGKKHPENIFEAEKIFPWKGNFREPPMKGMMKNGAMNLKEKFMGLRTV